MLVPYRRQSYCFRSAHTIELKCNIYHHTSSEVEVPDQLLKEGEGRRGKLQPCARPKVVLERVCKIKSAFLQKKSTIVTNYLQIIVLHIHRVYCTIVIPTWVPPPLPKCGHIQM